LSSLSSSSSRRRGLIARGVSFSSVSIVLFFFFFALFFFFFTIIILFQGEERLLFPWNPFALFHRAFQSLQLIFCVVVLVGRGIIRKFYYLVTSRSRGIYQSHEHVFRSSRSCSSSSSSRDDHRHFCAAKKCGKETQDFVQTKTKTKSL